MCLFIPLGFPSRLLALHPQVSIPQTDAYWLEHLCGGVSWPQKRPYYSNGPCHDKASPSSWLRDEATGNTMKRSIFKFFLLKLLFLAKNSTLFVCKDSLLFPILQTATLLVAHCEVHRCTLRIPLHFHHYVVYKMAHGINTHRSLHEKYWAHFVRVSPGNLPWVQWWECVFFQLFILYLILGFFASIVLVFEHTFDQQ